MSTISNFLQLPGSTTNTSSNNGTTTGGTPASPISSLLQAMQAANGQADAASNAFTLDLSPAAQNILNGGSIDANILFPAVAPVVPDSSSTTATGNFVLTGAQQKTLDDIMKKYEHLPVTQDNYDSLQNDLEAAGLAPQQLAMQDQLRGFSTTTMMLNALDGSTTPVTNIDGLNDAGEQSKGNSFMSKLLTQWQLTAPADDTASA